MRELFNSGIPTRSCFVLILFAVSLNGCQRQSRVASAESRSVATTEAPGSRPRVRVEALHWERTELPEPFQINKLYFVSREFGWAVGEGGVILHTEDGGTSWVRERSGTTLPLRDVWFATNDLGVVIGGSNQDDQGFFGGPCRSIILRTADGGHTWQPQAPPSPDLFWTLMFISPRTGWVTGWDRAKYNETVVYHTTDAGGSWQAVSMPRDMDDQGGSYANSTCFIDANQGWAVGDGEVRHTTDGGSTWEVRYRRPADMSHLETMRWVQFVDSLTGWVGGAITGDMANQTLIANTTDGGSSWSENKPRDMFNAFMFMDSFVGIGAGYATEERGSHNPKVVAALDLTTDGGKAWARTYTLEGQKHFNSVFVLKDGNCWAVSDQGSVIHCRLVPQ